MSRQYCCARSTSYPSAAFPARINVAAVPGRSILICISASHCRLLSLSIHRSIFSLRSRLAFHEGSASIASFSEQNQNSYTPSYAAGITSPQSPCRSEEHTSELQSLMRISYAVFCLKKKTTTKNQLYTTQI